MIMRTIEAWSESTADIVTASFLDAMPYPLELNV